MAGWGRIKSVIVSVNILHVFYPQQSFKAETSILGIYFIAFVHGLIPFSDLGAFSVY